MSNTPTTRGACSPGPAKSKRLCINTQTYTAPAANALLLGSFFFRLPLELREAIYEHAFETLERTFRFRDIIILASCGSPSWTNKGQISDKSTYASSGLPTWLRASKAICTEAVHVFSRSRTFTPTSTFIYVGSNHESYRNTLIFPTHRIRNIAIRLYAFEKTHGWKQARFLHRAWAVDRVVEVKSTYLHYTQMFLRYIKQQRLCGLGLELHWNRYWHNEMASYCPTWLDCENAIFDHLDEEWNGMFKSVKITVVYHAKSGDGESRLIALAEVCARRLLGGVASHRLQWGEEIEGSENRDLETIDEDAVVQVKCKKWKTTLIATRKV